MTKLHYHIHQPTGLSKEFRKYVYKVPAHSNVVVVQYIGNETVAVDFPHGNAKRHVNFVPTAKSVTDQMSNKTTKLCDLRINTVNEPEQYQPRNTNQ